MSETWDFVVNWSYSEASSYLTALLPARVKLGFSRRKDKTFLSSDGWSHYIQGVVQGGVPQDIHLTDILTTQLLTALQLHLGEPKDAGNSPVTSKNFFRLDIDNGYMENPWVRRDLSRKWMAIQLGAGQTQKTIQKAGRNSLRSCTPAIPIGALQRKCRRNWAMENRSERTGGFRRSESAIISLVGQTSFELWASVIGAVHKVLSTDTAALHL